MKKLVFMLCLLVVLTGCTNKEDKQMEMYFFSLGKADSILMRDKETTILVDTGLKESYDVIAEYLRRNNVSTIDYLVITHFDKDHAGSAGLIIADFNVNNIIINNYYKDNDAYKEFKMASESKNIEPIVVDNRLEIAVSDFDITIEGSAKIYEKDPSNNSSLICNVKYGDYRFLLMGDVEKQRLEDFVPTFDEKVTLIKMPHHGSYEKGLEEILNIAKPGYAVITSDEENPESDKTMKLLNENKVNVMLTRVNNVKVEIINDQLKVEYR